MLLTLANSAGLVTNLCSYRPKFLHKFWLLRQMVSSASPRFDGWVFTRGIGRKGLGFQGAAQ
jgi:hypothetical protein